MKRALVLAILLGCFVRPACGQEVPPPPEVPPAPIIFAPPRPTPVINFSALPKLNVDLTVQNNNQAQSQSISVIEPALIMLSSGPDSYTFYCPVTHRWYHVIGTDRWDSQSPVVPLTDKEMDAIHAP